MTYLTLKKYTFSVLSIGIFCLCSCHLADKKAINRVLESGRYKQYNFVNVSGQTTDYGTIRASYKISYSRYNVYTTEVDHTRPGLAGHYVEHYGLLTTDTRDQNGTFYSSKGFSQEGDCFCMVSSSGDSTYFYEWDSSTCLLLSLKYRFSSGSEGTYYFSWSYKN